jgi:hypothetical protein
VLSKDGNAIVPSIFFDFDISNDDSNVSTAFL